MTNIPLRKQNTLLSAVVWHFRDGDRADLTEQQHESLLRVVTFLQSGLGVDPGADLDDDGTRPNRTSGLRRDGTDGAVLYWMAWGAENEPRRGLKFSIRTDGRLTLVGIMGDHGPHHPHKIAMLYGNALCAYVPAHVPVFPALRPPKP